MGGDSYWIGVEFVLTRGLFLRFVFARSHIFMCQRMENGECNANLSNHKFLVKVGWMRWDGRLGTRGEP